MMPLGPGVYTTAKGMQNNNTTYNIGKGELASKACGSNFSSRLQERANGIYYNSTGEEICEDMNDHRHYVKKSNSCENNARLERDSNTTGL